MSRLNLQSKWSYCLVCPILIGGAMVSWVATKSAPTNMPLFHGYGENWEIEQELIDNQQKELHGFLLRNIDPRDIDGNGGIVIVSGTAAVLERFREDIGQ